MVLGFFQIVIMGPWPSFIENEYDCPSYNANRFHSHFVYGIWQGYPGIFYNHQYKRRYTVGDISGHDMIKITVLH